MSVGVQPGCMLSAALWERIRWHVAVQAFKGLVEDLHRLGSSETDTGLFGTSCVSNFELSWILVAIRRAATQLRMNRAFPLKKFLLPRVTQHS